MNISTMSACKRALLLSWLRRCLEAARDDDPAHGVEPEPELEVGFCELIAYVQSLTRAGGGGMRLVTPEKRDEQGG